MFLATFSCETIAIVMKKRLKWRYVSEHSPGTFSSSLLSDWKLFDLHVPRQNWFLSNIFYHKQTKIWIAMPPKWIFSSANSKIKYESRMGNFVGNEWATVKEANTCFDVKFDSWTFCLWIVFVFVLIEISTVESANIRFTFDGEILYVSNFLYVTRFDKKENSSFCDVNLFDQ